MVIPTTRLKFYRRVALLKEELGDDQALAKRIVQSTLYVWQESSYKDLLPTRMPYGCSQFVANKNIRGFAFWLSAQPFNEAAYWLASAYAILVGESTRAERALFFTPPVLAERVIDHLLDKGASLTDHHWHDPACGGAAFLVPIAVRMSQELKNQGLTAVQTLKRISSNLSGNDLDPLLLEFSTAFIEMALYPLIQVAGLRPSLRLDHGDGLLTPIPGEKKPDVLALNPPYRKLKAAESDLYRDAHGDIVERQPNIYGLFINQALRLVRPGGLIGLLTPTNFLSGQSFSKLRTKLIEQAEILQIDMLSARSATFIHVQQETAITVLRQGAPQDGQSRSTNVSVADSEGCFRSIGNYPLPQKGSPWPIPRTTADADWLHLAVTNAVRFSEYGYRAKIGHLVAYRDERVRFINPPSLKNKSNKKRVVPLVWATDITPNGLFEHKRMTKHFRPERFVELDGLSETGLVRKPSVVMQRLTSSDQKSRLVAAAVPDTFLDAYGGFVCENHVIVLEPLHEDAMSPEMLASLLNTSCVSSVFRCIAGSSNVSVFELNELLLPAEKHLKKRYEELGDMELAARAAYGDR